MREQLIAAAQEHDQESETDQGLQQRHEKRGEPGETDVLRDIVLVEQLELPDLGIFLGVGADHAHAREIFLNAAADVGKHLLDDFEAIVDAAAEQDHRDAHQRRRNQAEQRQPPVDRPHDSDQEEGGEERLGEVHDARAQHHADGVQIVGGARHDVAGAVLGVEILRESNDVREQVVAQIVFDVAGHADEDDAHPILENSLDDREQNNQSGELKDQREAKAFHQRIDAAADGQGQRGLR